MTTLTGTTLTTADELEQATATTVIQAGDIVALRVPAGWFVMGQDSTYGSSVLADGRGWTVVMAPGEAPVAMPQDDTVTVGKAAVDAYLALPAGTAPVTAWRVVGEAITAALLEPAKTDRAAA